MRDAKHFDLNKAMAEIIALRAKLGRAERKPQRKRGAAKANVDHSGKRATVVSAAARGSRQASIALGDDGPTCHSRPNALGFALSLKGDSMSGIENLTDESVAALYENIRQQVAEDARLGSRHHFLGQAAKDRAERLREEMTRRRLKFSPIEW